MVVVVVVIGGGDEVVVVVGVSPHASPRPRSADTPRQPSHPNPPSNRPSCRLSSLTSALCRYTRAPRVHMRLTTLVWICI